MEKRQRILINKEIEKLAYDKCGLVMPPKPNNKILSLIRELRETKKPANIMLLCDLLTDELNGVDTDGFRFR